jgi:hypothetical protein
MLVETRSALDKAVAILGKLLLKMIVDDTSLRETIHALAKF